MKILVNDTANIQGEGEEVVLFRKSRFEECKFTHYFLYFL